MLGPLQLVADGSAIDPGGPKQRALLAYLVLHAGEPASLGALIDAVWGEQAPDGAVRSLRTYVSNLRQLLGGTVHILGEQGTYRLDVVTLTTDIEDFRRLVRLASEVDDSEEVESTLKSALDLWRGAVLGDVDRPWVAEASTTLGWEHRNALLEWAKAALANGHPARVIPPIEHAASEDPYDEQLCELLMQALYQVGRQADALAAYRRLRTRLGDELGLEPGPALNRLEEQILLHKVAKNAEPGRRLPTPAADLVGRSKEVDDLITRAHSVRLLTLTGPGGVGKTRLAIEVGRRTLQEGRPVYFADLSATTEQLAIGALLAEAAGVQPHPNAGRLESLIEYLQPRRAMLIVDNCEHLAPAAARALAALLRGCPQLTIVATSRSPLHTDGEVEWRTPPLALPESTASTVESLTGQPAVELLVRRAPTSFILSDENAADVAALCRTLDGLPLGLELVAPRLGSMTPAEVVAALDSPAGAIRTTRVETPRHVTLEATVDWSYRLLPESRRQFLTRLGVMAGWFRVEDAHAICSPDASPEVARDTLSSLVEQSLVTVDTSGNRTRYRLLETIRRFAQLKLRAEEPELRMLHADHYAGVAEVQARRLLGPEERSAVTELAIAHDNFRAVVDWSLSTGEVGPTARIVAALPDGGYWRSRNELSRWSQWVWEHSSPADPLWRAICGSAARGAWVEGRFEDSARYASAAGTTGDVLARSGHPEDVIADIALYRGDARANNEHHARVAAEAESSGDTARLVWATYYLAVTYAVLGDSPKAVAASARAFTLSKDLANPTAMAFSLYAGGLAVKHTSPKAAVTMFEESIRLADSVSNEWFGGVARMELASTLAYHHDLRAGLRRFVEVVDHWQRVGDDTQLRHSWRYLVRALHEAGCHEGAATLAGALVANTRSAFTHPHPRVLSELADKLGEARYTQLTVRGSVMSTTELVAASFEAIDEALTYQDT